MCFGVRDAIALAKQEAKTKPLTILGELVHNESVLADLHASGIKTEKFLADVITPTLMISAHGASDLAIKRVAQKGHSILEATCPLVHHAHNSLRKLVKAGYHPVVIGKRDHVEVRGLTEDFAECDIVLDAEEISRVRERSRFGIVSQTTQPIEKVQHLVDFFRQHFPKAEVRFIDTVCQPTKQRQSAAVELAKNCEVIVVIGGANSNNTKELVATCSQFCARVHYVQNANDLQNEWFYEAATIGITAGTSTPDKTIDEVEQALYNFQSSHRQFQHDKFQPA